MKILWVVNSILPSIAKKCNIQCGIGGGWLTGISDCLVLDETIELIVCFRYKDDALSGYAGKIKYYSFGGVEIYKYNVYVEKRISEIIEIEQPDIVHIFGTEFPHSLSALNAAADHGLLDRTLLSIQGLVSVYAKHFYSWLSGSAIYKCTLRDFIKSDNIFKQMQKYLKRGKFEEIAIKKAKNIIGRTDWDEACVKRINDSVNYWFCNETLRKEFYSGQWDYSKCEKHSLFVGSCSYPIKGFHQVLEIMPFILKKYPDAKLYVPGQSPFEQCKIKYLKHKTYYQVYLKKLIDKYKLNDKVIFLGDLSAEQMQERMLKCNVYILPSSIENSPNTLGEAMLLGVPCIASDVGGVKNLAVDKKEALIYPFDENYMLPLYVEKIFDDFNFAEMISMNARQHALSLYDKKTNYERLMEIYSNLINN